MVAMPHTEGKAGVPKTRCGPGIYELIFPLEQTVGNRSAKGFDMESEVNRVHRDQHGGSTNSSDRHLGKGAQGLVMLGLPHYLPRRIRHVKCHDLAGRQLGP